ncbi:hypothetical protein ILUMI_03461, partial [Ignelater luminosus]
KFLDDVSTAPDESDPYAADDHCDYYPDEDLVEDVKMAKVILNDVEQALNNLKIRREAIVSRLVRLRGYVDSVDKDNLNENIIAQLTSRLERVQTVWEDFNDIQTNIEITERGTILHEKFMLADPNYNLMGDIDILLGAQVFWSILGVGNEHFNEITLQNTELGWVVAGTLNFSTPKPNISVNHLNINMHDSIDDKITKFWQLEEVNSNNKYLSASERHCEELFEKTTKKKR